MIEVISAGLYTTIQDMGRYGYRKWGVPLSGAMDMYAAQLANRLVNNTKDHALMEIIFSGPVLKFKVETQIAICGAGFSPSIDNEFIPLNTAVTITAGGVLKFGVPQYGLYGYLAVSGGFLVPKVLHSYSFYPHITKTFRLEKSHTLSIRSNIQSGSSANASVKLKAGHFSKSTIDVFKGPEFEGLSNTIKEKLLNGAFTISNESNRMGYRLNTEADLSAAEIITSSVQPGTVQLTPSGQLIVLMRDCQTTGGYARVLQLSPGAINRLAQKRSGASINFKLLPI